MPGSEQVSPNRRLVGTSSHPYPEHSLFYIDPVGRELPCSAHNTATRMHLHFPRAQQALYLCRGAGRVEEHAGKVHGILLLSKHKRKYMRQDELNQLAMRGDGHFNPRKSIAPAGNPCRPEPEI